MADPQYGAEHQRRRRELLPGAYNTPCPRCGELMLRGQRLHLGHSVDHALDSSAVGDRIEHADYSDCPQGGNTAAGGRLRQSIQDLKPSPRWWDRAPVS